MCDFGTVFQNPAYRYIGTNVPTHDTYFSAVETNNDTFTWYTDVFPLTADSVDIVCDNITSGCCSLEYCDHSIKNQIKYFINKDNIKM